MPMLARRGSISTRAFGQLSRGAIPTTTTYSVGFTNVDNDYDVSVFTFTRQTALSVSPFTVLSSATVRYSTQDLNTWTPYNFSVGNYGVASKYHVTDASYRSWIVSSYNSTANMISDSGNVMTQLIASDGPYTYKLVPNNLYDIAEPKIGINQNNGSIARRVSAGAGQINFGNVIIRNMVGSPFTSGSGPTSPTIVRSTDGGSTYSILYDTQGRPGPLSFASSVYGNHLTSSQLPSIKWSNVNTTWAPTPVGIWDTVDHNTIPNKRFFVGSGGMLVENDVGGSGFHNYTVNQALLNKIGKYTWLYKVAVNGNRRIVVGWGNLLEDYTAGFDTQNNFAAVSTDAGVTWTVTKLTTLFQGTGGSAPWDAPFGIRPVSDVYDNGTTWFIVAYGGPNGFPLATSTDGITWTINTSARTAAATFQGSCFAANTTGSVMLIGMNNSQRVLRSTDGGVNWTSVTITGMFSSNYATNIVWNGTKFVLLGASSNQFGSPADTGSWTSTDGQTWTTTGGNWYTMLSGMNNVQTHAMVDSNGNVYAIIHGQRVAKSSDGLTWTTVGTLSTVTSSLGYGGRCLYMYYVTSNLWSLYAIGDWASIVEIASSDSGSTWTGNWISNQYMWGDIGVTPPLEGFYSPVMTPAINSNLTITSGGTGYTANTTNIRFSKPNDSNGWEPVVQTITVTSGAITAITLAEVGAGYTSPPTVTITSATGGAGATATCNFRTAAANASIGLNRIFYWQYPKDSEATPYVGKGWYGTRAGAPSTGSTAAGNITFNVQLVKNAADVAEASNVIVTTFTGGFYQIQTLAQGITAETDTPGIIYTYSSTGGFGSGASQDSTLKRVFVCNYSSSPNNWGWTNPIYGNIETIGLGTGGSSSNYFSGEIPGKLLPNPIYDNTVPASGGFYRGIAWYFTGSTFQSSNDSTGARKLTFRPVVRKYIYNDGGSGNTQWILDRDTALPDGPWNVTIDHTTSTSVGPSGFFNIASNGVSISKRATVIIAWVSAYTPYQSFPFPAAIFPFSFITTDGAATWSVHTDLQNWMSANGYERLSNLYWNENEGVWILQMTKSTIVPPFDIVITPDFITYTIKRNTNYSLTSVFDNNNDITLFTGQKALVPSAVVDVWKSATTTDLDTWSEYAPIGTSLGPDTAFPKWGTGKYHVADASFRPWIQSYFSNTANAFMQYVSTDGLVSWVSKPNNLYDFVDAKTTAVASERSVNSVVAVGDTIFRNMNANRAALDVGAYGPKIVLSTDGGSTYSMVFDATGRLNPISVPIANSSGPKYSKQPKLKWSGSYNNYNRPPVGIWDMVRHPTITDKDFFVGSGGMLVENDPATSVTSYSVNQALLTAIGKYTWLYKVAVSGTRRLVLGWGNLPGEYGAAANVQNNFAAVSTDSGATWTVTKLSAIFTNPWDAPFGRCYYAYDDGTTWFIGSNQYPCVTSTNGTTWTINTSATAAAAGAWASGGMAHNGTAYVIAMSDATVLRSTNGSTWTKVIVAGAAGESLDVIWTGTTFVLVTITDSATSADGSTWTSAGNNWGSVTGLILGLPSANAFLTKNTAGSAIYALTQNQRVIRSSDGITWTNFDTTFNSIMNENGCGARVLVVYDSAFPATLYAIGDWAIDYKNISPDGGATWSGWYYGSTSQIMGPDIGVYRPFDDGAIIDDMLDSTLTITNGGSGYSANTTNVSFSAPDTYGGYYPTVGNITVSGGAITGITLADSGYGYTFAPPTVTITSATGGAGATATCSYLTSSANSSVIMKRVTHFYAGQGPNTELNRQGRGWYGTLATANAAGNQGNLSYTACLVKDPTDVADATATVLLPVTSGGTHATVFSDLNSETDTPGILYSTPKNLYAGTISVNNTDVTQQTIFVGNYTGNAVMEWGFTRPLFMVPDRLTTYNNTNYFTGPIPSQLSYWPVYASAVVPGGTTVTPGVAWFVTGVTTESKRDSSGNLLVIYKPHVQKYVLDKSSMVFYASPTGALPSGAWEIEANNDTYPVAPNLQISSDGTDPSKLSNTIILWSSYWQPVGTISDTTLTGVYPLSFISTDSGASWSVHADLQNYMNANGYLTLGSISWNENEGLWVCTMSKTAPDIYQALPFDVVLTADWITYTVKNNTETVNIL